MHVFRFETYAARQENKELIGCWLHSRDFCQDLGKRATIARLCNACEEIEELNISRHGGEVETREGMHCPRCKLNARVRACLSLLHGLADPASASIYVTEQATATYAWLQAHYRGALYGSEFEPDADKRVRLAERLQRLGGYGDVHFEDVTRLSLADGSQDVVLSFDVLEHVPDYKAALREFARVLKPGGSLIATFPFTDQPPTITRASINAHGQVEHHLPAEYHGDPISGGVLCFYHFGWDILAEARRAGFSQVEFVLPWAPEQGIVYGSWTLLARR
ncbi:methyltransferase domain-containing protein [Dyella sp. LX-66]|uniref:class I SAM-dependent methyltransferase n=1 Tax=unclassified Dyella TaxID=2634549 RepID=UPI001BE0BB08|nr:MULTISPECIES: class I SAM-dependent methyltransferase [unclassified Dyella]MBT2117218.1 methyltransferase domain-containing protein [Dyella sp. LX-1]MBT2138282.1 methyltransferase domain-containing protein [Dyella sp. LX-66]